MGEPPMGKWSLGFAWTFILGVAAYDAYFAWQNRAAFEDWEMNPLARWIAGAFGFGILIGVKASAVGFGSLVAVACYRCRRRLTAFVYTTVVGGLHLGLSLLYVFGRVDGY
jgi:hypothetical protein